MNENHYGVVVGINRYPGLRDLRFARNDAQAFANWLKKPDGGNLPSENVKLITVPDKDLPSGTPREKAKPVREQVEDALYTLRKICEKHIGEHPEDWEKTRLYVYVSGHGIAPEPEEAALLMADAGSDWYGRNFSCAKYLSFFEKAQFFKELVFFADCCRERITNAPPTGPTWTLVEGNNGSITKVVGFATSFGELAFEPEWEENIPPDEMRGYFTKALLEGLGGQAVDDPNTGEINSVNLAKYVTQRVKRLTKDLKYQQVPTVRVDPAVPVIFGYVDPDKKALGHLVTINFVSGYAGIVDLLDGDLKKIASHDSQNGPWEIRLINGLYLVQPAPSPGPNPFIKEGIFSVLGGDRHVEL